MARDSRILIAIALIVAAGLMLASMDATAKHLSSVLPVLQIVWARYFFHFVLMTAYLWRTGGTRFLRTRRPGLQLLRGATLIVVTALMYTALPHIPLADATSVQFFAPIMVTLLSAVFLKEGIGIHRIVAVVAGFAGVLLIVRPGFETTNPYLLLPLAAAFFNAVYLLMTRALSGPEERDATLFNTTAAGALGLTLVVPFFWQTPVGTDAILMVVLGGLGAVGHFLLLRGFSYAPASILSPFLYSQVLFASVFSVVLIGDPMRPLMIVGTAILVASGLYIWWRETR